MWSAPPGRILFRRFAAEIAVSERRPTSEKLGGWLQSCALLARGRKIHKIGKIGGIGASGTAPPISWGQGGRPHRAAPYSTILTTSMLNAGRHEYPVLFVNSLREGI